MFGTAQTGGFGRTLRNRRDRTCAAGSKTWSTVVSPDREHRRAGRTIGPCSRSWRAALCPRHPLSRSCPPSRSPVGTNPLSVAVADFNGDGKPDLVAANYGSDNVSACCWATATAPSRPRPRFAARVEPDLGGGGGLQRRRQARPRHRQLRRQHRERAAGQRRRHLPAPASTSPSGPDPRSVAVADFNGDGKPDLAVANYDSSDRERAAGQRRRHLPAPGRPSPPGTSPAPSRWRTSTATASPTSSSPTTSGNTCQRAAGQRRRHLPAAGHAIARRDRSQSRGGGRLQRRRQARPGRRQHQRQQRERAAGQRRRHLPGPGRPTPTGHAPASVAVATSTATASPTCVVANYDGNDVSVLLGNGDGTFQAQRQLSPSARLRTRVAVGDFNGDGKPDLVVGQHATATTVSVLLGNGDGTFQAAGQLRRRGGPRSSVAVGDFNGDGQPRPRHRQPQRQHGQRAAGQRRRHLPGRTPTFAAGTSPASVAVADFNGDGQPDLVVANYGDSTT